MGRMTPFRASERSWTPTCGVDAIEIERIGRAIAVGGRRFLDRVYTANELAYCRGRLARLAARFAAKEAVAKALGTGICGIRWRDMEILPDEVGRPVVRLYGRAALRAKAAHLSGWSISLSHSATLAIAVAIAYVAPPRKRMRRPIQRRRGAVTTVRESATARAGDPASVNGPRDHTQLHPLDQFVRVLGETASACGDDKESVSS